MKAMEEFSMYRVTKGLKTCDNILISNTYKRVFQDI